jgi:hypothetical protein
MHRPRRRLDYAATLIWKNAEYSLFVEHYQVDLPHGYPELDHNKVYTKLVAEDRFGHYLTVELR